MWFLRQTIYYDQCINAHVGPLQKYSIESMSFIFGIATNNMQIREDVSFVATNDTTYMNNSGKKYL